MLDIAVCHDRSCLGASLSANSFCFRMAVSLSKVKNAKIKV